MSIFGKVLQIVFFQVIAVSSFGNNFDFYSFLAHNDYKLQETFQNLNSLSPQQDGKILNFLEGTKYRRSNILDLYDRLKEEFKDDCARGLLILQLGHMFWQAQGYEPIAKEMESEGLILLRDPHSKSQEFSNSCESLQMLCNAIKKLQDEKKTDIYGFCDSKDYYHGLLINESMKLRQALMSCQQDYSSSIVHERLILCNALRFLKHNRPAGFL